MNGYCGSWLCMYDPEECWDLDWDDYPKTCEECPYFVKDENSVD